MGPRQSGVAPVMRYRYKRRTDRVYGGFTLLEVAVVAVIIAIMATILMNRVLFYQKVAEKTATEQTIGIMRSALHLQFASLIARNRVEDTQYLVGQNPMNWLAEKPGNYAGEFFGNAAESVVSGQWYFDLQDRSLVYLVHNHPNFSEATQNRPQLRYQVKLVLDVKDFPVNGGPIAGKTIAGVVLEQTVPYSWD
jgi:prepilin-type N-terminal cleavage/methylation domain-containing protein